MEENLPEPQLMFDEKLNAEFRNAAHRAFLTVPELRSVVVVYDYYRNLNDIPDVSKGMWLNAQGTKEKTPDSVVGSLGAVLQSAAHILDELMQQHNRLNNELVSLSKQILEKRNELNNLQKT